MIDPADPGAEALAFLAERHLATMSLIKADGGLHVTPVGFTYEPEIQLARVITWIDSWKAKHLIDRPGTPVAIGTVDGGRWLTLHGSAEVTHDAGRVAEAVARYTERYRPPKERSDRVVVEVSVSRIIGRA